MKKKKGKNYKKIFNVFFVILCFVLTIYYVFHGEDLASIITYMKKAKASYWVLGVFLVIAFIISESYIIYYLLNTLKHKTKFTHCCLYSFVGFFFSCITPSASGGQPAQAVFMRKDNIPIPVSTVVLLLVTISYKTILLVYGAFVLIFKPFVIMHYLKPAMYWVRLGMALNLVVVGFMLVLTLKPRITEAIVLGLFNLLSKVFKSAKIEKYRDKTENAMENFVTKSRFLVTHKKLMLKVFGMTFIQRTFLFLITYYVCLSFNARDIGVFDVTVLQGNISVAADMLPLPGGMGITEYLFISVFTPVVGKDLTVPVMIVSRGLSYYTQLLISALMTGVAYIKFYGFSFWKEEKRS